MKTFWTTFYSYKGGVGRSLALANVAAVLVERGHSVVLLDFDLEAPGLDTFDEFKEATDKIGIVEYVAEFQKKHVAPDIKPFVHQVKLPSQLRGQLWLMPSGRKDKAYNHFLSRTRWSELFNDGLGAAFIENWKISIEQEFKPDYVLIDSRTGLTEIGGVCTTAFPDLVVMLFGLNEQNVQGTAAVAHYIREAGLDRQPELHFVVTPIPNLPPEKKGLLPSRIEAAEKTLGTNLKSSSIRYWPTASLTERLFVLDDALAPTTLVQDHRMLCEKVTAFNRNGLDFITGQCEEVINNDDTEMVGPLSEFLLKEYPNRVEAVFFRSRLARLDGDASNALKLAEQAIELDPRYTPPFNFLCAQYRRVRQTEKIEQLCERILSLGSCLSIAYRSEVLTALAELRMSISKYRQAADHYAEILQLAVPDITIEEEDGLPFWLMINEFNAAESSRRAGDVVSVERWKKIITLFEKIPSFGGLATTANHLQAIHIAYAMVGDLTTAKESLRKAIKAIETINDLETAFSVRDYRFVNRDEFKTTTEELLAALDMGQLWDGMPLPPSTVTVNPQENKPQERSDQSQLDFPSPTRSRRKFNFDDDET